MSLKHHLFKILSVVAILVMLFSNLPLPAAQAQQAQSGDGLKRQVNGQSHRVSFLGPESGKFLPAAKALGTLKRPQDPAMALAKRYAHEFGLKDPEHDLSVMKQKHENNGRWTVRYQQKFNSIPVMAGELIVNTDDDGNFYSMNGEVSPDLSLDTTPTIDAEQAKETALQAVAKWNEKKAEDFTVTEPELWIFDESLLQPSTRPVELVWRMEVTPNEIALPVRELVLVNAQTAGISFHFNQIDTAWRASKQDNLAPAGELTQATERSSTTQSIAAAHSNIATQPSNEDMTHQIAALAGITWYVATTGDDANLCSIAEAPCATINAVLAKPTFTADDTVKVATGTYTGSGVEVVLLNKNVTLSGGWDASFTVQSGMSIIDGQNLRRGVKLNQGLTVTIERFVVRSGNAQPYGGSGIYNDANDTLTLVNSAVENSEGTGVYNYGTLTLNGSTVSRSTNSGIYSTGTLMLNNSTVSGNTGTGMGGGGILSNGTTVLNNSTITGNITSYGPGGGIYNAWGTVSVRNTIISGNSAKTSGPDCAGNISSNGYNLLGNSSGCPFTASTGDLINTNPQLGELIGSPGYYPLQPGSPAIDAGNPATPGSGGSACLANDARGIARPVGAHCDIGAYEYTVAGNVVRLAVVSGDNQRTSPNSAFSNPLRAAALDNQGSPVPNVSVTFSAPDSGASGTFFNTGRTAIAMTATNGIATSSTFTSNALPGFYTVVASAPGAEAVSFNLQNVAWYVSTTGSDLNDCQTSSTPCETINGALGKVGFVPDDTVLVGEGLYTSSDNQVVLVNQNVHLSGGWNTEFTTQSGWSVIDGQSAHLGMIVNNVSVTVEKFVFQHGYSSSDGGGIYNGGTLVLNNSIIQNNTCCDAYSMGYGGGGISNWNTLTVNNSVVRDNISFDGGGGIYNNPYSTLTLNNSTVSGNEANTGAGIASYKNATISNSTISGNWAIKGNHGAGWAGGIYFDNSNSGTFTITNSIVAGNWADSSGPDCKSWGPISSAGYNLIGNNSDCLFSATAGDLVGTALSPINPRLTPLQDNGGPTFTHALITGSPAIDAGNPATCLAADQRGVARPVGTKCDIGAYEGSLQWAPAYHVSTYTGNHTSSLPGSLLCNQNDPTCFSGDLHAKAIHKYVIGTYNFYANQFLRDSINNAGMEIKSTVHYCNYDPDYKHDVCPYDNAFWDGAQMVYGDEHAYPLADDVVAHELTHGVTQYESNLFYYYQSGAINESLSDLWGEYYDQMNNQGNDAASVKWRLDEDLNDLVNDPPLPLLGIRDMKDPTLFFDPDRMTSSKYYKGADDNGGVHWNSGVNNKAVYLMVDGDTFNYHTVTGLGWDKVAAIYYEANTNLLTSGADYSDLYYALQLACVNLIGEKSITSGDCTQVKNALDAVEMNTPLTGFNQDVPFCDGGQTPTVAFADDLENGTTNWSFDNGTQVRWQYDSPEGRYAQSGLHSLYANDYPQNTGSPTDAKARLISFIVPNNAYLRFAQAYEFETGYEINDPTLYDYDGGVLEYSINGGSTWMDASSLQQEDIYNGSIYSDYNNPLAGRRAFVGSSHGYISTQLDLSSLAGKTVSFRWRMGLDGYGTALGWWVDNIKVYYCGSPTTFADVPNTYWAWSYIERLYSAGITGGCGSNPRTYCPTTPVTRDQMAIFLLRGKYGSSYVPPTATGVFQDVPINYWAANWIEQLAKDGITSGCSINPKQYCPTTPVTRDQMAIFLLRAKYGSNYVPPKATGIFQDVPTDYWAADWIEQLAAEGVTVGCSVSPKKYCPTTSVTRDQMAIFLVRNFNLP